MKNSGHRPHPPEHLGTAGRDLWRSLAAEYGIGDAAGMALLTSAAECLDRVTQARAEIERDGLTIRDRFGQPKPHPAAAIERDARGGLLAALKALNLDVEPLNDGPGRPAGR